MTFWNATIGNWGMPYLNTSYFNTPYMNPFSPFTLPSYTNPPLGFVQPKNSVFDYNIFGFTTPYNFCYTPFLKDVNPPYNIFDSYIGTGKIFDFASNGYNPFNSNIFSKPTAPVTFSPSKSISSLTPTIYGTGTQLPQLNGVGYDQTKGAQLARYAKNNSVGFTGYCAKYVKNAISGVGLGAYEAGNANDLDDILRRNKNFKEISTDGLNLSKLPAGCILVYEAGVSGYNKQYGHVEITMGDGTAISDGVTNNIRKGAKVFVPVKLPKIATA